MPEQPAEGRVRNFEEVPFGLRPEQARVEARRCLQCKKPQCVEGCPVGIDIPGFIRHIVAGDFLAAARKLKEDNTLPAVCGRVCPQETQCEGLCVVGRRGDPVAIGNLERFAADYERQQDKIELPAMLPPRGVKVAVIGSGPAGLTAAGELARRGYSPTIFEALHEPGGVLLYGIPSFRLPKEIVHKEIGLLRQMGVEIVCDFVVGKTATIQDLMDEGYAGVFIGTGAGTPILAGVPGENLNGVLSANEYLTRVNLMRGYRADYATPVMVKDRVAVLGGGNVAMDSARVALRLGAKEVTIVYRRSVEESPARVAERHHAEEEGIRFEWLTNAVEIQGDEKGWVSGLRCIKMELGEPGADGRRRPYPHRGLRVRDVDGPGDRRLRQPSAPAGAAEHARPGDSEVGRHRDRGGHRRHLPARRLRRRRHSHRRRHRHPGHGRRQDGRGLDGWVPSPRSSSSACGGSRGRRPGALQPGAPGGAGSSPIGSPAMSSRAVRAARRTFPSWEASRVDQDLRPPEVAQRAEPPGGVAAHLGRLAVCQPGEQDGVDLPLHRVRRLAVGGRLAAGDLLQRPLRGLVPRAAERMDERRPGRRRRPQLADEGVELARVLLAQRVDQGPGLDPHGVGLRDAGRVATAGRAIPRPSPPPPGG